MSNTPRIWVGALAAYNNGTLHGEWIELDGMNEGDLEDAVQDILNSSPEENEEEWLIADHDGFCGVYIQEYAPLEDVLELAERIDSFGADATVALVDAYGSEGAEEALRNRVEILHQCRREPGQDPDAAVAESMVEGLYEEIENAIGNVLSRSGSPYAEELARSYRFDAEDAARSLRANANLGFGEDANYQAYAFHY